MKFIALLFCVASLNAATIVQDYNDDFGVRTTIELTDSIYTYQYDVKAASFIDWSSLGIDPINRVFSLWKEDSEGTIIFTYTQEVPLTGSYTVKFDSFQAPVEGHIQSQLNFVDGQSGWNVNGWIPSVPEPTFMALYMIACIIQLTRRIR